MYGGFKRIIEYMTASALWLESAVEINCLQNKVATFSRNFLEFEFLGYYRTFSLNTGIKRPLSSAPH